MLTVCSLIFLVLSTLRVQNFARRDVREFWLHWRKFIQAKKTEIYDWRKLIHAKKKLFYSIRESSSTSFQNFLLLFYQLYVFLFKMSGFISRKKRCFQPN